MTYLWILLAAALLSPNDIGAASGPVYRMAVVGPIGPAVSGYFDRALTKAEEEDAVCLVVEMDTPGGLMASMRAMVKRTLSAEVPVVVYVAPSGARAASAGAFLAMASHVAAMAPGTNIGAAHPVQLGGGRADTTMSAKAANDAAAYMKSLAQKRGRDTTWAREAVLESASITAEEAASRGVVEFVVPTFGALTDSLDGLQAEVLTGTGTLETKDAEAREMTMSLRERLLARISDPNVAYILMLVGVYGILFELYNPGTIFPAAVGAISLILAFYAFQTLPINYAGVLLILAGVVLFLLEVKVASYGLLTVGGTASLILGSAMLLDTPSPAFQVSWWVIVPAVGFTALFFLVAVGMGLQAQRRRPRGGLDDLPGRVGVARTEIGQDGTVFVGGEYWRAFSETRIAEGQEVDVLSVDGNRLRVRARE